jgi:hypothetical protein
MTRRINIGCTNLIPDLVLRAIVLALRTIVLSAMLLPGMALAGTVAFSQTPPASKPPPATQTPATKTPPAQTYAAAPEVLTAIRQNYQEITRLAAQGMLLQIKRDFGCLNALDSLRILWKDRAGIIRKYQVRGGSEDSATTVSQYYGPDGRINFALVEDGAVNGTQIQTRLYFGAAGNVIRSDQKMVHGPGYTFEPPWQKVVQFPETAFDAPSPC